MTDKKCFISTDWEVFGRQLLNMVMPSAIYRTIIINTITSRLLPGLKG